jgi:hypothetical protein
MSDVDVLSEFQSTKINAIKIENQIKDLLIPITRSENMNFDRCADHGERCVPLTFYFDEMNVNAFDEERMKALRSLLGYHHELRMKQKVLETKIDTLTSIKKGINKPYGT